MALVKPCALCGDAKAVAPLLVVPWRGGAETVLRCGRCGLTYVEEPRRTNRPFELQPGETLEQAWQRQFPDELDVHAAGAWAARTRTPMT